jgi:hypothetical protein
MGFGVRIKVKIKKIRDQARHENVSTTELYAPKKESADDTIIKTYYKL